MYVQLVCKWLVEKIASSPDRTMSCLDKYKILTRQSHSYVLRDKFLTLTRLWKLSNSVLNDFKLHLPIKPKTTTIVSSHSKILSNNNCSYISENYIWFFKMGRTVLIILYILFCCCIKGNLGRHNARAR